MKTKTSSTPGPWYFSPLDSDETQFLISSIRDKWVTVAICGKRAEGFRDSPKANTAANAALIAAAPDLLAALQRCLGELIYATEKLPYSNAKAALEVARLAIAKAEGIS